MVMLATLLGKPYSAHHGVEPGFGRNRLERRVVPRLGKFYGPVHKGLLQRDQCRLPVSERIVNQGDAEGRYVLVAPV